MGRQYPAKKGPDTPASRDLCSSLVFLDTTQSSKQQHMLTTLFEMSLLFQACLDDDSHVFPVRPIDSCVMVAIDEHPLIETGEILIR
jgi:hypothetical protein